MLVGRCPRFFGSVADEEWFNVEEAENRPRPALAIERVGRNVQNVRLLSGWEKRASVKTSNSVSSNRKRATLRMPKRACALIETLLVVLMKRIASRPL